MARVDIIITEWTCVVSLYYRGVIGYILRDFKNAPFYILCLFHMIYFRMFTSSFYNIL